MNEANEKLYRDFNELKGMERQAYTLYRGLVPLISDPVDRKYVEGIMADELRHEQMVQEILDLLETD
ncbi:MAG: ferritin-like domain-containing protein [Patescibacteria group bacterium]|jgi:rubrerythrin